MFFEKLLKSCLKADVGTSESSRDPVIPEAPEYFVYHHTLSHLRIIKVTTIELIHANRNPQPALGGRRFGRAGQE